jgi:iron complex transport system substrate-binding protein
MTSVLTGCPADTTDGNNNNTNDNGNNQVSYFPLTVIDDEGREVTIESEPQKIVSLAPSNTETAFALELDDRIVGVTTYCDYPTAALDIPKVGGFSTVDIEQVTAIQPDLVLAANIHVDEVVPQLENLGLTVIVVDPRGLDEILESIIMVGRCTGKYSEAVELVQDMQSRINVVKSKVSALTDTEKPKVFFIIWHDPLMTAGPDTNHFAIIESAGGVSVSRGMADGFPTLGLEALLAADPDIMISDTGMGSGGSSPYNFISEDPRLAGTSARVNGKTYQIDANIVNRAGPRIVDALEAMAEIIHPELFE